MDVLQQDAAASIQLSYRCSRITAAKPSSNIPIALQCLDGQSYLSSMTIPSHPAAYTPNVIEIVRHIRACRDRMTIRDKHETLLSRLFAKTIVGTAELQQVILKLLALLF